MPLPEFMGRVRRRESATFLASDHKTPRRALIKASATLAHFGASGLVPAMTRYGLLLWFLFIWIVGLYGVAVWALLSSE
jgi:hypothetical protein